MATVLSFPSPIARLNDQFRTTFVGGRISISAGIHALPEATQIDILTAVQDFSGFTEEDDPHDEHDYGLFVVDGHECMFKIGYYDKSLEHMSKDAANPEVTTRILTVMLAIEH